MKMLKQTLLAAGMLIEGVAAAQHAPINNISDEKAKTGAPNYKGTPAKVSAATKPQQDSRVEKKYPFPPFTLETALQKVQLAEDAWNSQDPQKIAKAYTIESEWRNRDKFVNGREEIVGFLSNKWKKELNYKLKKEYWAHTDNRIAVRFEYEYMNKDGNWFRAYGNENWEFDENGLMKKRYASINDLPIKESDRKFK